MMQIFISGSRSIKSLPTEARARLAAIAEKGFDVIIGDADGADRLVQAYYREAGYTRVTVYHSGATPRRNEGAFKTVRIIAPAGATGRAFHTAKDAAMAAGADYGLILWDGSSQGSLRNARDLVARGRAVVIIRNTVAITVRTSSDLIAL